MPRPWSPGPMPVTSVEDAMAWLFRHTSPEEWLYASEADLPDVVMFACDMFWVRPSDLVRRMRRQWESAMRDPEPISWRHRRPGMGRN